MNKRDCTVNNWLIDLPAGALVHTLSGERKRLGEFQLRLLEVLAEHAGEILSRDELTSLVWANRVIGNNSLPNAIHALRSALEDNGKQQRIIKTIPKKGYLLEAEYCRFGDQVPLAASEPEPDEAKADKESVLSSATDVTPGLSNPTAAATPPWRFSRSAGVALALLVLLGIIVVWAFTRPANSLLIAEEQEAGIYSHIRLYEMMPKGKIGHNEDDLLSQTGETFYLLNQALKAKSATMTAFHHSIDQTLDYTFELKNRCGSQQLAMVIYHWRSDEQQLNKLLLSETQRKLNEMPDCSKPGTPAAEPQTPVLLQLGLYNLMAQHQEIYDVQLQPDEGAFTVSVTRPDDASFLLKGKFSQLVEQQGKYYFTYTSLYQRGLHKRLMIAAMVEGMLHVDGWIQPVALKNQPLVVSQSGRIFLFPLNRIE